MNRGCVVQKFGGTSVATIERIRHVANIVAESRSQGSGVVVVVSAMAGVTNKFVSYVNSFGVTEGHPEYDTVLSSGELVTAGLTAIALENIGVKARSYASWQVPVITDNNHGRAVIKGVDPSRIQKDLASGIVPVICGFQGISEEKQRITTLGRGGSDLTAVAVASAIGADICEIYSDVDGVYTVDPNLFLDARRIDEISYPEMLEMAAQGAKVLQEQSVKYAMQKGVVMRVASSFIRAPGTIIAPSTMPRRFRGITVTQSLSQLKICLENSATNTNDDIDKLQAKINELLASNYIHCDFLQKRQKEGDLGTLVLNKNHASSAISILKESDFVSDVRHKFSRKSLSKISVVGSDFEENCDLKLRAELKNHNIDSFPGAISKHKINIIVTTENLFESISILHKFCGLDMD